MASHKDLSLLIRLLYVNTKAYLSKMLMVKPVFFLLWLGFYKVALYHLFSVFLSWIISCASLLTKSIIAVFNLRGRGPRNPGTFLTDTDFVDDITLISSRIANAETLLKSLESAAKFVGLYPNESKT